jgi:hypothetical protein
LENNVRTVYGDQSQDLPPEIQGYSITLMVPQLFLIYIDNGFLTNPSKKILWKPNLKGKRSPNAIFLKCRDYKQASM